MESKFTQTDDSNGEMAEWLKAHAWKACLGETLTWVRIPVSPPGPEERRPRMKRYLASVCVAITVFYVCNGLQAQQAPLMTMGITLPLINQPASVQVVVSNPEFSPVPTGAVTIDFGDGDSTGPVALTNMLVSVTHTYTAPGEFAITANYSGDEFHT